MGSALVAFLPAQAPITFPRNFNFCPVLAQIFSFYFSSDFSAYGQHPLSKKCMFPIARGIAFLSPIDVSHRCKNLPDSVRGVMELQNQHCEGAHGVGSLYRLQ